MFMAELFISLSKECKFELLRTMLSWFAYNLVDVGNLGLEDGDGVTDGRFLVHLGACSEGLSGQRSHTLSLIESCEELGQHSRYLLNLYISSN